MLNANRHSPRNTIRWMRSGNYCTWRRPMPINTPTTAIAIAILVLASRRIRWYCRYQYHHRNQIFLLLFLPLPIPFQRRILCYIKLLALRIFRILLLLLVPVLLWNSIDNTLFDGNSSNNNRKS